MKRESKRTVTPRLRFPEFRERKAWPVGRLDDFVDDFLVPMRDKPSDLSGDIPWCRIEDFDGMYLACSRSGQGVHTRTVADMNLRVFAPGTLLVSCSADLGRCAIVQRPLVTNQTFIGLVPKADHTDVRFLYYLMSGQRARLNTLSSGTTISYLSRQSFESLSVAVPTLHEQRKIAACLGSLDDWIGAESRMLEALRSHKKGLMQQLFPRPGETRPRLRFPEFRKAGEWEEKEVGEVFRVTRGEVLAMPLVVDKRSDDAPYPVYSSQTKNVGLAGYFSDYLYEDAITWTTDGANAGDVNYRTGKFFCTNVCGVLISDKGFANPCTAALINSVSRQHVSYVGNPKLMNGVMAKIRVPFPPLAEQQRIAACLSSLDDVIVVQTRKVEGLKAHKKGLMQQLFPVAEEDK